MCYLTRVLTEDERPLLKSNCELLDDIWGRSFDAKPGLVLAAAAQVPTDPHVVPHVAERLAFWVYHDRVLLLDCLVDDDHVLVRHILIG